MKVNVNLFKQTGKWYTGGVVEVSGYNQFWSAEFKEELLEKQDFVKSFTGFLVVVTHRDDYDSDPSPYFCQHLFGPYDFEFPVKDSPQSGSLR